MGTVLERVRSLDDSGRGVMSRDARAEVAPQTPEQRRPVLRKLMRTDAPAVLAAFESDSANMARQGEVTDLASAHHYVDILLDREDQWPFAVVLEKTVALGQGSEDGAGSSESGSSHRFVQSNLPDRANARGTGIGTDSGTATGGDGAGALVGLVGVSIDRNNLNGWFWYWMSAHGRGRGWMSAAVATVADWALSEGGLYRLELGHRVNNPASGAVARAAGFVKEGTERGKFLIDGQRIDVDTYSRLATDPQGSAARLELRSVWRPIDA